MRPDIGGIAQVSAAFWPASGRAPTKLDSGLDDGRSRWAHARLRAQFSLGCSAQPAQVPKPGEQILGDLQDILPRPSAAQQDREQLGVGESVRSPCEQAFTRAGFGGQSEECGHAPHLSMRRATWAEDENFL
jgi:hypothetical protein